MVKCPTAPIAQWIERCPPEAEACVRLAVGVHNNPARTKVLLCPIGSFIGYNFWVGEIPTHSETITYLRKGTKRMSMFSTILKVLGFGKDEEDSKESTAPKSSKTTKTRKTTYTRKTGSTSPSARRFRPAKSGEMPMVDVVSKLEAMAAENPEKLDWKVSIVDLLKLLGIDSSYEARKELARELDIDESLMDDSAKMNIWLHKTVMKELAANGGNVPKELLD